MTGLESDTDLAVGLKAADPWTMAGAGIDDDERPPRRIDFDSGRRHNAHESVIHWPIELCGRR